MSVLFSTLGGLGLFLYGIRVLGTGLQKVAGERLKRLMEISTNKKIVAVFVGIASTILIQSSTATSVMVVGFVNAGIMNLTQAISIMMGANIGTTITTQIIAFELINIALLVIVLGVGIWIFTPNKRCREIGELLIGFGILFIGMEYMKLGLAPLKDSQIFLDILFSLKNPFLGLLVGFGLTVIIQSSSAAIALLLALGSQGIIDINTALPLLLGANIGTSVTSLLSSVETSKEAKRAATAHMLFNIIGVFIFIIFLIKPLESVVQYLTPLSIERQIANAHSLFNIVNVIIQLPFVGVIIFLTNKIIKGKNSTQDNFKHLDSRIIEAPSIAVNQALKEVIRMGKLAQENLKTSIEAFINQDQELTHKVFEREKLINKLEKEITEYIVDLTKAPLSHEQHATVTSLLHIINDLERVGDHADNIAELAQYTIENRFWFTDKAIEELKLMFNKVEMAFNHSLTAFSKKDTAIAKKVIQYEEEIDLMEKKYRANHIDRLNQHECYPSSGIVFLDAISNLERIADHSSNIALLIIDENN